MMPSDSYCFWRTPATSPLSHSVFEFVQMSALSIIYNFVQNNTVNCPGLCANTTVIWTNTPRALNGDLYKTAFSKMCPKIETSQFGWIHFELMSRYPPTSNPFWAGRAWVFIARFRCDWLLVQTKAGSLGCECVISGCYLSITNILCKRNVGPSPITSCHKCDGRPSPLSYHKSIIF